MSRDDACAGIHGSETVNAADVTSWSDEVDVVVIGFGIAGGCAAVSAAAAGRPGAGAGDARPPQAAQARWRAATSISAAAPRCSRRPATTTAPRRCTSTWSPCRASPTTTRSAHTATAASSTSTGWRTWGFSSSAASTRARSSSRRAPRGCRTPATRRCGRSCEQAKPAPRGHSVPVPGELGGAAMVIDLLRQAGRRARRRRSATRPARPTWSSTTVRWSASAGSTSPRPVRSRPRRSIIAAGGFAMNPEMVAEHTPALGQKRRTKHHGDGGALHPGQPQRRRPGHPDWVSRRAASPRTWTRCSSPPPPTRRRSCSPASSSTTRASASSPRTPITRARRPSCWNSRTRSAYLIVDEAHMQMPEMPLIQFIDGWETVEEMEAALGIPEGNLVATLRPVQRERRARRGSRLPQAAGIRCGTRQRAVGGVRSVAGPGDVLRVHHGRPGRVHRRRSAARGRQRRFPVCTPQAHARPTSPRTARATPAERSWAKARSSAAARERTRPGPKPARGATAPPPSSARRRSWCCSTVLR